MSSNSQKLNPERFQLLQRSKERASICLRNKEYERAVAHMLVIFKLQPDKKRDMKDNFIFALGKYKKQLEDQEKWDDLFECYKHALEVYPECECIHHDLGSHLFKLGHIDEAASYFRRSLTLNPNFAPARISLENIRNSVIERWHFIMLNDKRRNSSFQQAIHHAIQEGCSDILDIGTGTGILSMIAAREGATNIYACEKSKLMYQLAQDILISNGMENRITLLHKESTDIKIPRDIPHRMSLVVTETFDAGLFGEHVLTTLHHAWKHLLLPPDVSCVTNSIYNAADKKYNINKNDNKGSVVMKLAKLRQCSKDRTNVLKRSSMQSDTSSTPSFSSLEEIPYGEGQASQGIPGVKGIGRVIPNAARMWICLIECHWIKQNSRMYLNKLNPVDFKNIVISSEDNPEEPYTTENLASLPEGYMFLTDPSVLLEINFNNPTEIEELIKGKVFHYDFVCKKDGSLDAIAVWFDLFIDQHTTVSTNPGSESCWEQVIFPIRPHHIHGKSQSLKTGMKVKVQLICENYLKFGHIELTADDNADIPKEEKEYMFLDCRTIQKINDVVMNSAMKSAIHSICCEKPCLKFIDMTQFAWSALFVCKLGAAKVAIAQLQSWDKVSRMRELSHIKQDHVMFTSVEHLSEYSERCWDVLITELIEPTGLIRNQVLEDIALLKASCLKPTSEILPGKLRAYVMLIQSPSLLLQSKLVNDSHTLNFKIAEFVNIFQARVHQDIQLSTLPHEKLSQPALMWEIDFNEPLSHGKLPSYLNIQSAVDTIIVKPGEISALVYWFVLDYGNGNHASTIDAACSWRQAAVVLSNAVHVHNGEKLTLMCLCKKSVIDIYIQTTPS